jgi:DNA polymerase-3 subunit gamma/tau
LRQAQPVLAPQPATIARELPQAVAGPKSYAELVALAGEKRDLLVKHALEASLHPIAFADGRLEVALEPGADPAIIQTLSGRLKLWTGRNWLVTVSNTAAPAPTLRQVQQQREATARTEAHDDPLVRAILETFPGATVTVRLREAMPPAPPAPSDQELEAQFEASTDIDEYATPDDEEDD